MRLRIEDLKTLISEGQVNSSSKKQVLDSFVCPDEEPHSLSANEELFNLTTEVFWSKPLHDSIFVFCSTLKSEAKWFKLESLNKFFAIFGALLNKDDKIADLFAEFCLFEDENQKRSLSLCAEQFLRVPDMVANIVGRNIDGMFNTDDYLSRWARRFLLRYVRHLIWTF